jgi:TRAP-type uncharacterized transport system fused permease subunit
MGATAFLIADFLQVDYSEVVLAALVPALLYYVCLFLQVDAIAVRFGLHGLPKAELPKLRPLLRQGWVFLLPLAVLIYLLFFRRFDPAWSALVAALTLMILSGFRERRLPRMADLRDMLIGSGESMLPLLMIAGGAGIVIGVMNSTGLGFSLSLVLTQIGGNSGLFVMLLLTGAIAIVLGRVMQVSGATKFFTDFALALMGSRRGGPAKVAVVASSVFGSINGTAVGNIMSTGIVTIPLMKKAGFKPQFAAAIEAVASNGGQFAPPVMGATAFLIADFLQIRRVTSCPAASCSKVIVRPAVVRESRRPAASYVQVLTAPVGVVRPVRRPSASYV